MAKALSRTVLALTRASLLEQVAYRGEIVVWVLSTTMPLVMLALFSAVTRDGAIAGYDGPRFVAYYLATFLVRQVTSSWAAWPISEEVRDGTMAARLLRPVHPLWGYAGAQIASLPVRAIVAVPAGAALLVFTARGTLTHDPALLALFAASLAGAWLLANFISFTIGALAFFLESSLKVLDLWLAAFFVFSGYLVPVALFPAWLRRVVDLLPFRYQIGLPVEILIGAWSRRDALRLLSHQWLFVALACALTLGVWQRGLRRFAAFGG